MPLRAKQIAFILRGCDVKRYHALYTVQQQTVGEHSARVALLVQVLLQEDTTARVLQAALYHDLAEQVTGDMPADIKKRLGLTEAMAELENEHLQNHGFVGFPLTEREQIALKLADCLDGVMFCNREIELGNLPLLEIKNKYLGYIDSMKLPSDWRHVVNELRYRNP